MKFWDQLKKNKPKETEQEYHREKSNYDKSENFSSNVTSNQKQPNEQSDALKRLLEDEEIRQRVQEELASSKDSDKNTFGQMIGKGVETLGGSLKKVSKGQSLLDEEDKK